MQKGIIIAAAVVCEMVAFHRGICTLGALLSTATLIESTGSRNADLETREQHFYHYQAGNREAAALQHTQ